MVDAHADWAMIAVQGPEARAALEALADGAAARPHAHRRADGWPGVDCLVCGTGYTGEDGAELLMPPDGAVAGLGRAAPSGA